MSVINIHNLQKTGATFQFTLEPAPEITFQKITQHPQGFDFIDIAALSSVCKIEMHKNQNSLFVSLSPMQSMRLYDPNKSKPEICIDRTNLYGYSTSSGEYLMDLYTVDGITIRIKLLLEASQTNHTTNAGSNMGYQSQQLTSKNGVTRNIQIVNPQKLVDSRENPNLDPRKETSMIHEASSNVLEDEITADLSSALEQLETVSQATSVDAIENSKTELSAVDQEDTVQLEREQLEKIVDDLLKRLTQAHQLVDSLIEQQDRFTHAQNTLQHSIQTVASMLGNSTM